MYSCMQHKNHIIVVGAGFGGITTALMLAKKIHRVPDYDIILIDRNEYQLYTPALYEIAAVPHREADVIALKSIAAIPIARIVARRPVRFIQNHLSAIDRERREIIFHDGSRLPWRFLVLALGSETSYFNIPGLAQHGHPLKKFEDAIRIRNAIESRLASTTPARIVVGGAGPSGVELIAELANFICMVQKDLPGRARICQHQLTLIEAGPHILNGFAPSTVTRAMRRLTTLGIEIRTNTAIAKVDPEKICTKNRMCIAYDLLIWTGGVTGLPICQPLALPLTPKGNCMVDEYLRVENNIFVVGDAAGFYDAHTKQLVPWNVPAAESEGRLVAKNIFRAISGRALRPFHPARSYPFVLAIGEKYAIADLVFFRFWGFLGWIAKLLVELRYLFFILPYKDALRVWHRKVILYMSNDRR